MNRAAAGLLDSVRRASMALVVPTVVLSSVLVQAQAHRPQPGDTLRYRQVMKMDQVLGGMPTGDMNMTMTNSAIMRVVFGRSDTVRVYMDSVQMSMTTPMGDMNPPSPTLSDPYVIVATGNGRFHIVSSPKVETQGGTFGAMGDMPDQMDFGFMLPLPAGGLKPGATWSDTTHVSMSPTEGSKVTGTTVSNYTVASDTSIDGEAVNAIRFTSTTKGDIDLNVEQGGMSMNMKGTNEQSATGTLYYSPSRAIVVARSGKVSGGGTQNMTGPMTMTMTTKLNGDQSLTLIH